MKRNAYLVVLSAYFLVASLASAECVRIAGYSNTRAWQSTRHVDGFSDNVNGAAVESIAWPGMIISRWADPANWPNGPRGVFSECASGPVTVAVLQAGQKRDTPPNNFPGGTVEWYTATLLVVLDNIAAAFPALEQIGLIPITGGPSDAYCSPNGRVASAVHPHMTAALQLTAELWEHPSVGVTVGPDLEVESCSDYTGPIGHITREAQVRIGAQIAEWFADEGWAQ